VQKAVARSPELRQFADQVLAVDRALANPVPAAAPEHLHAGIMRAVRSAGPAPESGWNLWRARLLPAAALALLLVPAVFETARSSRPPVRAVMPDKGASLELASATLEDGGDWVRAAPQAVLEPLTTEMRGLDQDLTKARDFLLAAVP